MTVADLIALLSEMPEDAEVRLATQPSWPLAFNVHGVATGADVAGEQQCDDHGHFSCDECAPNIVWITEGGSVSDSPYAPSAAWAAALTA